MLKIKVSGMTCGHCAATVTTAVRSVHPGIAVSVDLEHGEVTIAEDADHGAVRRAIAAAGYDAIPSDEATSEAIPANKASRCCGC